MRVGYAASLFLLSATSISINGYKIELPDWVQDLGAKFQGTKALSASGFARLREKVSMYQQIAASKEQIHTEGTHIIIHHFPFT